MRLGVVCLLLAVSCASPSVRNERSLRAYLRDPNERALQRLDELTALLAVEPVASGLRLAAVHHALRLGVACDVDRWLDAEAADNPRAAAFLAAYRDLYQLPARPVGHGPSGVVVVLLADRTHQREFAADFLATAEPPLRARGFYVVPVEITADVLADLGDGGLRDAVVAPASLRRLRDHGITACLRVDVRDFWLHEAMVVEVARFDVDYELRDTATGDVLWQRPALGDYERREPVTAFADDDETFYYPSSLGAAYGDAVDFVRALNQGILRTVPAPGDA